VEPPFKVVMTPVEAQTFDVTVSAPNPLVQVFSEGPQGPGVPRGGVSNDLLVKQSSDDFDTDWQDEITVDALTFDVAAGEPTVAPGRMGWNAEEGTVDLGLNGNEGAFLHVGQETLFRVSNKTGQTILKGAVCRFAGTVGASGRILTALYDAAVHPAKTLMGLAVEDIPDDEDGYVVHFGKVRGVNTAQTGWVEGDILFAAPGVPGGLTRVVPAAPNAIVTVAALITRSATVGEVFVRPTFAPSLSETQDVRLTGPADGEALLYDGALDLWVNEALPAAPVLSVNGETGTVVLDAADVGAYADTNPSGFVDAAGAAAAAPVQSVNGDTGTVVLDATDVGAYPDSNPSAFVDAAGAAIAAPVQSVNGAVGTVVLGASDVGAIGTAVGLYVEDYSTAPSVRPVAAAVYWRGTVAPGTAVAANGDLWYDTTGDS
jgi:hypothetical protein